MTSKSFFFILKPGTPLPSEGDYWKWEGDVEDFKILQPNPMSPPYNFSVTPTDLKVETVNGKTTVTFHSKMGNGSKANFTIVKLDEINMSADFDVKKKSRLFRVKKDIYQQMEAVV